MFAVLALSRHDAWEAARFIGLPVLACLALFLALFVVVLLSIERIDRRVRALESKEKDDLRRRLEALESRQPSSVS